jgi:predicted MFS family arabinose efflux permease
MCCNMKKSSTVAMAMMGMGMAMMAGMMMGSCMSNRMNSNKKSMKRFGMMKKSDESDLQKA